MLESNEHTYWTFFSVFAVSDTWMQPETKGTPPAPRHGHVIAAVGSVLYVHGGMAGEKFYSDMFSLDTGESFSPVQHKHLEYYCSVLFVFHYFSLSLLSETMKWEKVKAKGDNPPGVAAHASVNFGKNIFIFGGMTAEGATNCMYRFQCGKYLTKQE